MLWPKALLTEQGHRFTGLYTQADGSQGLIAVGTPSWVLRETWCEEGDGVFVAAMKLDGGKTPGWDVGNERVLAAGVVFAGGGLSGG